MQPSYTKTSFLMFPGLQKSLNFARNFQYRYQNAFKIGFVLETRLQPRKIRFLMFKRRQDGSPNFLFVQKSSKILARRSLVQAASWKHPKAFQEPPKSFSKPSRDLPQPSRASRQAPERTPRTCFADLSTFLDRRHKSQS